jgi:hypothetical protein
MKEKKMPLGLLDILKKMHEVADVEMPEDLSTFKDESWYEEHTWTSEQKDSFENWLFDFLAKNLLAQREILGRILSGDKLKEWCQWFTYNYGWKLS